ncbi:Uncharacterised protein [Vibrio cholerae]|uniref:Uncharacterized protein n=1 Tax=Vibrio cholerae TaxID=666 RepID=A0A655Z3V0_VIBCL|nr:Uncharacterised protein [Vibrio cholerae]CSI86734.1 Uncharacterised protein [Vibrio cholerae]
MTWCIIYKQNVKQMSNQSFEVNRVGFFILRGWDCHCSHLHCLSHDCLS